MATRTWRYDTADHIDSDELATAYAEAALLEGHPIRAEDHLVSIAMGLGLRAIATLTGLDHDKVCMSLKAGDLLPGETTAEDVLRVLSEVPAGAGTRSP